MKHQINSFRFALKGIVYTIKHEVHMRFHIVAGAYVILFANFFPMTGERWAILLILIGSVMMAEIFNTALEELCNLETDSYNPLAKIAKDVAAGAVLIIAIIAVVIAFLLFWQPEVFLEIWNYFTAHPVLFAVLLLSFVISGGFVILGPLGIKNLFKKKLK